jgi:hypothetical protein
MPSPPSSAITRMNVVASARIEEGYAFSRTNAMAC